MLGYIITIRNMWAKTSSHFVTFSRPSNEPLNHEKNTTKWLILKTIENIFNYLIEIISLKHTDSQDDEPSQVLTNLSV